MSARSILPKSSRASASAARLSSSASYGR
jgi:hypothetical protein